MDVLPSGVPSCFNWGMGTKCDLCWPLALVLRKRPWRCKVPLCSGTAANGLYQKHCVLKAPRCKPLASTANPATNGASPTCSLFPEAAPWQAEVLAMLHWRRKCVACTAPALCKVQL